MDDVFDIRIEKLVYGGDGLGRRDGQAVFVARAAPGDLVRVRVTNRRKGFLKAEIVDVVEPGPGRREAPCPVYGACGGCQLQHVDYATQTAAKAAMVLETLNRLAGLSLAGPVPIVSEPEHEFGYRIRATAHLARGRDRMFFGFYAEHTNRIVDVESCMLLVPELDAAWQQAHAQAALLHRVTTLELAAGDGAVSADPPIAAVPGAELTVDVDGLSYTYPPGAFFQVNRPLIGRLVRAAVADLGGTLAVDLFAGVGLFSLPLARAFERVIGVEASDRAAAAARANADRNGVHNVTFDGLPVDEWLADSSSLRGGIDAVLLDPPRAGLGPEASARLAELAPRDIVYVSCDPSTLARDLRELVSRGYGIASVEAFDLFPQTYHVETIARLRRDG